MRLTVTITLDIDDTATDEQVVDLLAAVSAQVEDDGGGIVNEATVDAPHPAWQAVA